MQNTVKVIKNHNESEEDIGRSKIIDILRRKFTAGKYSGDNLTDKKKIKIRKIEN